MKNRFYFVRHGYSCANMKKQKKDILSQKLLQDPHLSNWGILSSIIAGFQLKDIIGDINFDLTYCSPLLRTWETSACMFSDKYKTFYVAPYLRERLPNILGEFITTKNDNPLSYEYNVKKFEEFKNFIKDGLDYVLKEKNSNKKTKIENYLYNIKYFNIKINENYDNKYIEKGNLEKFINWCNSKYNNKNILIVCHGSLIKNLLSKYNIPFNQIKQNNNFCVSFIDNKPKIIYDGMKQPTPNQIKNIRSDCSLCETYYIFKNKKRKCENKQKNMNAMAHKNLL